MLLQYFILENSNAATNSLTVMVHTGLYFSWESFLENLVIDPTWVNIVSYSIFLRTYEQWLLLLKNLLDALVAKLVGKQGVKKVLLRFPIQIYAAW